MPNSNNINSQFFVDIGFVSVRNWVSILIYCSRFKMTQNKLLYFIILVIYSRKIQYLKIKYLRFYITCTKYTYW